MLEVKNISKKFGDFALSDISFDIDEGDYFVLMGRSGSGKTQLLELIAGLTTPDTGSVVMQGREITYLRPHHRNVGLIFQDFAVFPHMSTFDNIAYPLRIEKRPKAEICQRVKEIAVKMNIVPLLQRRTTNLSGGELQRTAIARTLITSPALLLLDEPLASIDASLKDDITRILRSINRSGQTIIHVTHDFSEAVGLASKVGVIHNGKLIQTGTPHEVFSHPVNRFVARYTGIRNFFRVQFSSVNGQARAKTDGGLELILNSDDYTESGLLIIRSSRVTLSRLTEAGKQVNTFPGRVIEIVATPTGYELEIDAGDRLYASIHEGDTLHGELREGMDVAISMAPDDLVWLKGTS
jgi:ABC-type sugar transport system ATPase subunit